MYVSEANLRLWSGAWQTPLNSQSLWTKVVKFFSFQEKKSLIGWGCAAKKAIDKQSQWPADLVNWILTNLPCIEILSTFQLSFLQIYRITYMHVESNMYALRAGRSFKTTRKCLMLGLFCGAEVKETSHTTRGHGGINFDIQMNG